MALTRMSKTQERGSDQCCCWEFYSVCTLLRYMLPRGARLDMLPLITIYIAYLANYSRSLVSNTPLTVLNASYLDKGVAISLALTVLNDCT